MGDRLRGKVAIVTGAGSRGPGLGNGKAAAILFAREGARVLCVDQGLPRAEETVALIRAEGGAAAALAADVTRAENSRAMVEAAVARWGGLDILHNNVGIESRKDLLETTEEEWDQVLEVDLKSVFLATRAAAPAMRSILIPRRSSSARRRWWNAPRRCFSAPTSRASAEGPCPDSPSYSAITLSSAAGSRSRSQRFR